MTRTLSLSDVKTGFPRFVRGVELRNEQIVITRNGKPAAIMVNVGEYESLMETLEIMSDPKIMAALRANKRYLARGGKGYTVAETFGE